MDLMAARRRLMMQLGDSVPNIYEKVEWIEMPSGAYINTTYVPVIAPKIETRMQLLTEVDADLFSFASNTYPSFIVDAQAYGNNWFNRWGSVTITVFHKNIKDKVVDCVFGQNTVIDGDAQTSFPNVDWGTNIQTIRIGGGRTLDTDIRVYIFKMYDGNRLTGNFIPCVRKADSKPGMYDTVSKTFYTNAGTGEFIIPS